MVSCSTWCMIARRVSKPNICRLLMPHCFSKHGCEPEVSCFKQLLVFTCLWELGRRLRCMSCVSVVVCVARKPRPCLSYSRRRDCINSALLRSYYKKGGGTACGQRHVDSKNSQTTPPTTSTSSIHQLLGAADAQTAHHATLSTAPTHQLLGSANAETTPARAPAAVADRKQQPDAICEGKNGCLSRAP